MSDRASMTTLSGPERRDENLKARNRAVGNIQRIAFTPEALDVVPYRCFQRAQSRDGHLAPFQ
eukprot:4929397-Heterocapsa_arctica.AAC.1